METEIPIRQKLRQALRLGRALRLVWQSARGWTIASMVLLFVQGLLPLFALYLTKLVVDAVANGITAPDKAAAFRQVAINVGLAAAVALLIGLFRSVAAFVSEGQSQRVSDHMYGIVHAKSTEVDLEFYENAQYFDTLHRAQQEAPYRPTRIVNDLIQLGQSAVSILAIAGLLCTIHWGVTAIVFVASVPGLFVRVFFGRRTYRWQRQRTQTDRWIGYYDWLLTGQWHAKEIRLFDLGTLFARRFGDLRKLLRREQLAISVRRSIAESGVEAGSTVALFGTLAFVAYRTVLGLITIGDLVMFYQALTRVQSSFQSLLSSLAGLYEDNLFISNLYEFLDLKPKVVEPAHPAPIPRPMKKGIEFAHVSFQYPNSNRRVLEDIDLAIRPGEKVAVVGENGSGKTTLIKLLCRLYDPLEGTIRFDGMDLKQFETKELRQEIGVIFQDFVHYYSSVRENIWFGKHSLTPDDGRIVAAARQSGADAFIARLPRGYETTLGKWFEEGEELSFGEWQKVALARAFLRDAQVIVLDEPTSAMDAKAEYEVFKRFGALTEGKAAILISHRFSTVRMADCIYVLADGRIIEGGTHDELVRRGGMYARLFELQAQFYR